MKATLQPETLGEARMDWISEALRDKSTCDHHVCMPSAELNLHFAECESIYTESSYKFTAETIQNLLEDGFELEQTWMDGPGWYSVTPALVGIKSVYKQAHAVSGHAFHRQCRPISFNQGSSL